MTTANGGGDVRRSVELLWRGREQAAHGPRPTLTVDGIVRAGVAIADRDGLHALSMRRVATELGVGTMSLYRYVPGKGELLDLMLDHVRGSGDASAGERRDRGDRRDRPDWRAALEHIAETNWLLFTRHPWLLQVHQTRQALGPHSLAFLERALAALHGLGLTAGDQLAIISAVDNLVSGAARNYLGGGEEPGEAPLTPEEFRQVIRPRIGAGSGEPFPRVASLGREAFTPGGLESMRFALQALLDGVAGRLTPHPAA